MRKRKRIYSTVLLVSIICLFVGVYSSKAGPNQAGETTEPPKRGGTVTDIDGNTYPTVMIGTQLWMAENLRVTRYNNGDAIPNITDAGAWMSLNSGSYCEYNNNIAKVATYGRLYNWFAATDDRNLAPTGWHVPSDAEWQTLVDFLGGNSIAGGKMKETGYMHWQWPNDGATNESGFSALPGGARVGGNYGSMGDYAEFCSTDEDASINTWERAIADIWSDVFRASTRKTVGFSIRCIKGDGSGNVEVKALSPQATGGIIPMAVADSFHVDIWANIGAGDPDLSGGKFAFEFYSPDESITTLTHLAVQAPPANAVSTNSIEYLNGFASKFNILMQPYENGWGDGTLPDTVAFEFAGTTGLSGADPDQAYIRFNFRVTESGTICIGESHNGANMDWLFDRPYAFVPQCWAITACPADNDFDGICNAEDNCIDDYNPSQSDLDDDGLGDACDQCTDVDGDGYGEPGLPNSCTIDNCPTISNPGQIDSNFDGIGDACTFSETTPVGEDVFVDLGGGFTMDFETVNIAGTTELTVTTEGEPLEYGSFGDNNQTIYHNIETTSDFSGNIEICLSYSDDQMSSEDETGLRMYHYLEVPGEWEILPTTIDVSANLICGITTSLSGFIYIPSDTLCGDANGDTDVNILDIVFIINFLYKGGEEPIPSIYANVVCDDRINILDVVRLINYKYKNAPEPGCCRVAP